MDAEPIVNHGSKVRTPKISTLSAAAAYARMHFIVSARAFFTPTCTFGLGTAELFSRFCAACDHTHQIALTHKAPSWIWMFDVTSGSGGAKWQSDTLFILFSYSASPTPMRPHTLLLKKVHVPLFGFVCFPHLLREESVFCSPFWWTKTHSFAARLVNEILLFLREKQKTHWRICPETKANNCKKWACGNKFWFAANQYIFYNRTPNRGGFKGFLNY